MPTLVRWYIKSSFACFVAAMLMSVALTARPALSLPAAIGALGAVYVHFLTVGWLTQLIMGVAYWMFPKYSKARPRRSERLGWAAYALLNAGLLLRLVGEPLTAAQPESGAGWLLALSAAVQALAGWAFVVNTWARIKER